MDPKWIVRKNPRVAFCAPAYTISWRESSERRAGWYVDSHSNESPADARAFKWNSSYWNCGRRGDVVDYCISRPER